MLQVRLRLLQQSSSFSLCQAASCPHCLRQSFPGAKAAVWELPSTRQNEEESLWMRAEHIACLARNPWASWQMQESLAPLSLVFWLLLLLKMLQRTEVRNAHHLKELVTKLSDDKELRTNPLVKYTLQATKLYGRTCKIILPAHSGEA